MPRTLYLMLAALAVAAGGCQSVERHLVFRPTHTPEPSDGAAGIPLSGTAPDRRAYPLDLTTADGTPVRAWWCPVPGAGEAVLYCHGNAGDLSDRAEPVARVMAELGQSVLVFDYPGYGGSGGRPSEAGCYAAADAGYDWLTANGFPADRVTLVGVSLGGGVAVDVASRRPARAVVLVKTFTSVPDVAAHLLLGLPVQPLVRTRFDSLAKIGRCPQPTFVASGTKDRLIPFRQGERLFAAAAGPKRFHPIAGSDHDDPLTAGFFAALRDFLDTAATLPAAGGP
ncbi:MAG: alpha/beta hydrolase [Gemmataceae bacterium]|nr:alpha/beta hydrolase [Gemmataceae bacterium]